MMEEGLFKIIPIEGKGVGWVALQEIKVGTLILLEKVPISPIKHTFVVITLLFPE